MNNTNALTNALIEALTTAVRCFSIDQVCCHWPYSDRHTMKAAVDMLKDRAIITIESHLIHPPPESSGPEFVWMPGDEEPDFSGVAYRLRSRWSRQKRMTPLAFPTRVACEQFGGTRVRPRASELSHDVHFAEVYLQWMRIRDKVTHWKSGDLLRLLEPVAQFGSNIPDAVILNANGQIEKIVEGGGRYARGKLELLHETYRGYAYELW